MVVVWQASEASRAQPAAIERSVVAAVEQRDSKALTSPIIELLRALTPQERAVTERLLSVEFRDVEYFRAQVPTIRVTATCKCGCGTLQFAVDRAMAAPAPLKAWEDGPDVIVEGDQSSWLMLFQNEGWITELEHVDGYGRRPQDIDASTIQPGLQVEDSWFSAS